LQTYSYRHMIDENNIEWTCTDPDNHQYGREIRGGVYEFKEWIGGSTLGKLTEEEVEEDFDNSGCWEQKTINLADYNDVEINSHVSGFYDSLDGLKEECGDDWMWIVAECIFEMESELY